MYLYIDLLRFELSVYSESVSLKKIKSIVATILAASVTFFAQAFGQSLGDSDEFSDRRILEVFFHTTGGSNWLRSEGWLSNDTIENWYGVSAKDGRVIAIDLRNNNLEGRVPLEIKELTELRSLDLRWNSLGGVVPVHKGFHQISVLLLSNNQFSGKIPRTIGSLQSLKRIDVSNNQLTGELPEELGRLQNLESLSVHHNKLTGRIPLQLGKMASLKRLILSNNFFKGGIPEALSQVDSLRHLNLSNNNLSGGIPGWIEASISLEWIDLRANLLDPSNYPVFCSKFLGRRELQGKSSQMKDRSSSDQQPNTFSKSLVLSGAGIWGESGEIIEDLQARSYVVKVLDAIHVVDGKLMYSIETLPEISDEKARFLEAAIDGLNKHLEATDHVPTSKSELEKLFLTANLYTNNGKDGHSPNDARMSSVTRFNFGQDEEWPKVESWQHPFQVDLAKGNRAFDFHSRSPTFTLADSKSTDLIYLADEGDSGFFEARLSLRQPYLQITDNITTYAEYTFLRGFLLWPYDNTTVELKVELYLYIFGFIPWQIEHQGPQLEEYNISKFRVTLNDPCNTSTHTHRRYFSVAKLEPETLVALPPKVKWIPDEIEIRSDDVDITCYN